MADKEINTNFEIPDLNAQLATATQQVIDLDKYSIKESTVQESTVQESTVQESTVNKYKLKYLKAKKLYYNIK